MPEWNSEREARAWAKVWLGESLAAGVRRADEDALTALLDRARADAAAEVDEVNSELLEAVNGINAQRARAERAERLSHAFDEANAKSIARAEKAETLLQGMTAADSLATRDRIKAEERAEKAEAERDEARDAKELADRAVMYPISLLDTLRTDLAALAERLRAVLKSEHGLQYTRGKLYAADEIDALLGHGKET